MNAAPAPIATTERPGGSVWLGALLALAVGLAAVTTRSLWIDEACTASKATQATIEGWWRAMVAEKGGDLQMPLYMLYVWATGKVIGTSEWALRAANIPWFVAGVVALLAGVPRRMRVAAACVTLASPVVWYYLNEARPYLMQLGASLMIFAALLRLSGSDEIRAKSERRWFAVFCVGFVALSGSSLLGMVWAASAGLGAGVVLGLGRLMRLVRTQVFVSMMAFVLLLGIGMFYLWTLKIGSRGSPIGTTDVRNLFFIAYALLGFGGLGPGRFEMRGDGLAAFRDFAIPLALYGVVVATVLLSGSFRTVRDASRTQRYGVGLAVMLAMTSILGTGYAVHFRVLERHFTPLLPIILYVLAAGIAAGWSGPGWLARAAAIVLLAACVVSCLSYRLVARHEKDDYRGAATFARLALAEGKTVWWSAAQEGAAYYHVPLADEAAGGPGAVLLINPAADLLARLPAPQLVIASKPDVYDGAGTLTNYLRNHAFTNRPAGRAFTGWAPAR